MAICLAIESSCDEFSMALFEDEELLMVETLSQIDLHAKYGGVIPELASREHAKSFPLIMEKIESFLEGNWTKIDEVAVTVGPGLSGALLVGIQVAKTIALALDVPLKPVHHILGHIYSPSLTQAITYPMLSLVVSGGHTELVISKSVKDHEVIGATRDDACGEVYDKVAKKLGFNYPGGRIVDDLSYEGKSLFQFSTAKMEDEFAFSFSGIKSAVINEINRLQMKKEEIPVADICCSFQTVVVEDLIGKLDRAIQKFNPSTVAISGGVSANSGLRSAFEKLGKKYNNLNFVLPELKFCGDNAAMIGAARDTAEFIAKDAVSELECFPNLALEEYLIKFEN